MRIVQDFKARRASLSPMDDLVLILCVPGYDSHLGLDQIRDQMIECGMRDASLALISPPSPSAGQGRPPWWMGLGHFRRPPAHLCREDSLHPFFLSYSQLIRMSLKRPPEILGWARDMPERLVTCRQITLGHCAACRSWVVLPQGVVNSSPGPRSSHPSDHPYWR
jgi:hypothetical protein